MLLGVLQFSLWFDVAVQSGSCSQGVCDLKAVPLADVCVGCAYSRFCCALAFLGGARPLYLSPCYTYCLRGAGVSATGTLPVQ